MHLLVGQHLSMNVFFVFLLTPVPHFPPFIHHPQVIFTPCDLTQTCPQEVVPKRSTLCLFCHFIVEMAGYVAQFGKFFADLVTWLKPCAIFLLLDPVSADGQYQSQAVTQQMLRGSRDYLQVGTGTKGSALTMSFVLRMYHVLLLGNMYWYHAMEVLLDHCGSVVTI